MKLNLVLHGLFAGVLRDKNIIELWVPSIETHKYEWEEWQRGRVAMTGGGRRHDLSGITGGAASPDALQPLANTVLQGCPMHDIARHCTIRLPFPEIIYPLRRVCKHRDPQRAKTEPPFYSGKAADHMHPAPEEIAMVNVFEYTISNLKQLSYEGRPVASPSRNQERVRLHLWADPPHGWHNVDPGRPTPVEETITAITGLAVRQEPKYRARLGALEPLAPLPPEMEFAELYNRSERDSPSPPAGHACDSAPLALMNTATCPMHFYYNL